MISDYTTLITQIINWIDHDEIRTTIAQDLIELGERRCYREMRNHHMEFTLSATMTGGVVTLPAAFIEFRSVRITGSPDKPLEIMSSEEMYRRYPTRSSDSKPSFAAIEGQNLIFGPFPDSNYTVKGIYYRRLTALSDSNTTNTFTNEVSDALFFASLAESEPFLKNDPRVSLWEAKYEKVAREIKKEEDKRLKKGSPRRMREA